MVYQLQVITYELVVEDLLLGKLSGLGRGLVLEVSNIHLGLEPLNFCTSFLERHGRGKKSIILYLCCDCEANVL